MFKRFKTLRKVLAKVFVPVYLASSITTVPEYLRKRFGRERISIYIAFITLTMYAILKIAINVYSGALFIEMVTGWSKYASIFSLLLVTCSISIAGGLTAVMYIDALQAMLMIVGAFILFGVCLKEAGVNSLESFQLAYLNTAYNLDEVRSEFNFTENYNSNLSKLYQKCAPPPDETSFKLLRPIHDTTSPWLPWLVGCNAVSLWYWCTDQLMVQRTLSAKSKFHAQMGALFACACKFMPLVFMIIPGMLARILFPSEVACIPGEHCEEVCGNPHGCANFAFPLLIVRILPSGLKGLLSAVMIAALMSDLESIFNSAATLFTIDIWIKLRPKSSQSELVFVGRLIVVVLTIWAILWIPVIDAQSSGQLFFYGQEVANYLTPPIGAAFLLAVTWKGANECGTFWGMTTGTILGLIRLIMMISIGEATCSLEENRPWWSKVHFLTYSSIIFITTLVTIIIVSKLSKSENLPNLNELETFEDNDDNEISIFDSEEPVISTSKNWRLFDKVLNLYQRHTDPMPSKKQEVKVNLELSTGQSRLINCVAAFLLLFYFILILVLSL